MEPVTDAQREMLAWGMELVATQRDFLADVLAHGSLTQRCEAFLILARLDGHEDIYRRLPSAPFN